MLSDAFADAWRALLRHKAARTVAIGGVVFYSLLYPLPYHNEAPQKLPLTVADMDRSDLSRQLLRMIDSTEGAHVAMVTDSSLAALESLKAGDTYAVLVIPDDFSRNILRGSNTVLPLYCDAVHLLSYRVAFTGIRLAAENLGAGVRVERYQKAGMPQPAALSLQVRGQAAIRTLYNPSGNYLLNTVPAVFVVILQQTLLISCAMLAGASRKGESAPELTGRLLLMCCLFLAHAVYYFWLLPVFYDVPRPAHMGGLLLYLLPFFWAAGALGCIFGRLLGTPENVFVGILPCSLPLLFLSGVVWPPEAMPTLARWLAELVPTTPAIVGYQRIVGRGATLAEQLPLWTQLWGQAFLYYAFASL